MLTGKHTFLLSSLYSSFIGMNRTEGLDIFVLICNRASNFIEAQKHQNPLKSRAMITKVKLVVHDLPNDDLHVLH